MQEIIAPIPVVLLRQELNSKTFLRTTNKGDNHIYIVDNKNAPNTILEIGRLREQAFREGGGGTGLSADLDVYDTGKYCYKQLVVWSPADKTIVGGYRFILCKDGIDEKGEVHLSTAHYFNFSDKFKKEFLPFTIELGRSFVQPEYQSKDGNRKGLFSLDNLWDGLGALTIIYPEMNFFFGKVTMYQQFNQVARDCIISFLYHYFPDQDQLVTAKESLNKVVTNDVSFFTTKLQGLDFKEGHILLNQTVKQFDENIPPLVNSYMNLSATMKTFGTAFNPDFGDVEETGILIDIREIYPTKKDRHINTFSAQ
jgi:hypothetical protein